MAKSAEQARRAPAPDMVTERPFPTLVRVAEAWRQGAERRKKNQNILQRRRQEKKSKDPVSFFCLTSVV